MRPPPPQAVATLPKTLVFAPSLAMLRAAEVIFAIGRVTDPEKKYTAATTASKVQQATTTVVMMICETFSGGEKIPCRHGLLTLPAVGCCRPGRHRS